MKIYGAIQKIDEWDDGTIRIHGVASTEDVDSAGEIVRADAMRAALDGYRKYPALREMHSLSAAGTTLEIDVGDDNITRIVGHIVDPVAVKKVLSGTYRGLSIGGKVTQRDSSDRKVITGIDLREISLVDRPCNGSATLSLLKIGGVDITDEDEDMDQSADDTLTAEEITKREFNTEERRSDAKSGAAMKDGSFPIENKSDLRNAIRAIGRAKDPSAAKAHIKRRAAALGASDMIPDTWKADTSAKGEDALDKTVEPKPLTPTSLVDLLNDAQASMDTAMNTPVAGKHVAVTLTGGSDATAVEVKNPEEVGRATPKPLGETDTPVVEHVAPATPTPGKDTRTRKQAAAKDKAISASEQPATEDQAGADVVEKAASVAEKPADPVATARAAADAALKAAITVMQRLAKREIGYSPVLAPGMELRKGLETAGRLGYLLCELAYVLNCVELESQSEGDNSPVPAKLHAALGALAAAYKAMSDEELQELLDGADATVAGEIALAAAGGSLTKAFQGIVDTETLTKFEAGTEDDRIGALEGERNDLLKTISGLTETMTALSAKVEILSDQPLPPKTVTKAADPALISVSKEQDSSGLVRQDALQKAAPAALTEEDIRKALDAMPEADRAMLLMKAALTPAMAHVITR